jgi:hypothetical protein
MLERIINIAPGSDYKHSSAKTNRYQRTSQFLNELHSSVNDSISLSPATSFLASVHWKLKKFQSEKEKYVITFDFDGFEFTVHVGQPDLVVTHSMEYNVKKVIERISSSYLTTLYFNTPHFAKQDDKIEIKDKLPYLTTFVNELVDLNEISYLIKADSIEVKKIFFEKEEEMRLEFDYLNSCMVGFLEKYLSMKFNSADKRFSTEEVLSLLKAQVEKVEI